MSTKKKPSSGFTENIESEVNNAEAMGMDNKFHDIQEIYVSESGHARALFATRYGKRYALKCLKQDYLYTPIYRQVLAKEFEIALQLDHPNICHTIGMEDVEGYGPAIIMEYIDGQTLRQFIDKGLLTRPSAWKIFHQLTDALSYMHSKGIYHRDLKPDNIMLTYSGNDVRLIDFSLSDSSSFSILKSPAGTIGYIAPEQLLPDSTANAQSDIYSLGKVLEDLAHATGDKKMMRIGKACDKEDVSQRPANIGVVLHLVNNSKQIKWAYFLIIVCILLALSSAIGLHKRIQQTQKPPTPTYQTTQVDSNDVEDYSKWYKK